MDIEVHEEKETKTGNIRDKLRDKIKQAIERSEFLSKTESDVQKLVDKVVELGNLNKDDAKKVVSEYKDKFQKNREEWEKKLEDDVQKVVSRFRGSNHAELTQLSAKVERLEAEIASLEKKLTQKPDNQ